MLLLKSQDLTVIRQQRHYCSTDLSRKHGLIRVVYRLPLCVCVLNVLALLMAEVMTHYVRLTASSLSAIKVVALASSLIKSHV